MMKHEFESLIGYEVTPDEYRKIEHLYTNLDHLAPDKQEFVKFYRSLDHKTLELLYEDVAAFTTQTHFAEKEIDRLTRLLDDCNEELIRFRVFAIDVDSILSSNARCINTRKNELFENSCHAESEVE